jgi:hypothetical protein
MSLEESFETIESYEIRKSGFLNTAQCKCSCTALADRHVPIHDCMDERVRCSYGIATAIVRQGNDKFRIDTLESRPKRATICCCCALRVFW